MKRASTILGIALVLQFGGAQILPSVVECLGETAGHCTSEICCCCHRAARPAGESVLADTTAPRENCFQILRSTCGGRARPQSAITVVKDIPHSRFAVAPDWGAWSVTSFPAQEAISGHHRSDIPPPRLLFL